MKITVDIDEDHRAFQSRGRGGSEQAEGLGGSWDRRRPACLRELLSTSAATRMDSGTAVALERRRREENLVFEDGLKSRHPSAISSRLKADS